MNVSLRILNISSPERLPHCRPAAHAADAKGLECSVVLEQDLFRPVDFDSATIVLRGRLKTLINGHVSTSEVGTSFA